jgi:tetratricopeptide (TPR) repeat protein
MPPAYSPPRKKNNREQQKPKSFRNILLYTGGVFVLLHFLLTFIIPDMFPQIEIFGRMWGFDHLRWLPVPVTYSFYITAVLLIIPWTHRWILGLIQACCSDANLQFCRRFRYQLFLLCSLAAFPLFWILQCKYALLGDGYLRIAHAEAGVPKFIEYGVILFYHHLFNVFRSVWGIESAMTMKIVNMALGCVYVFFSLLSAQALGCDFREKAIYTLALNSSGILLIFCGYIETYAPTAALAMVFVYLSIRSIQGTIWFILPMLGLALALFMAAMSAIFLPAALVMVYISLGNRWPILLERKFLLKGLLIACALCLASLTIPVLQKGFQFALQNQLRFLPDGDYQSHILSWWHINEIFQSQLIAFTTGVFLGVWLFWVGRRQVLSLPPMFWFLLFLTIAPLSNNLTFNAVLGSFDWDLRAFTALGFAILIPYMLFHLQFPKYIVRAIPSILLLMLGFNYLSTGAWLLMNSRPESVNRTVELMYGEKADYYVNHPPPMVLEKILQSNGLSELADQQIELAFKMYPTNHRTNYNYARGLYLKGKKDEALKILYRVFEQMPEYPPMYQYLAEILSDRQDFITLELVLRSFFREYKNDPGRFQLYMAEDTFDSLEFYYMISLNNNKKYDEAIEIGNRLVEKSCPFTMSTNVGEITIQQFIEGAKKEISR